MARRAKCSCVCHNFAALPLCAPIPGSANMGNNASCGLVSGRFCNRADGTAVVVVGNARHDRPAPAATVEPKPPSEAGQPPTKAEIQSRDGSSQDHIAEPHRLYISRLFRRSGWRRVRWQLPAMRHAGFVSAANRTHSAQIERFCGSRRETNVLSCSAKTGCDCQTLRRSDVHRRYPPGRSIGQKAWLRSMGWQRCVE